MRNSSPDILSVSPSMNILQKWLPLSQIPQLQEEEAESSIVCAGAKH